MTHVLRWRSPVTMSDVALWRWVTYPCDELLAWLKKTRNFFVVNKFFLLIFHLWLQIFKLSNISFRGSSWNKSLVSNSICPTLTVVWCLALKVEIDEYQNYEKAVGALTEAFKCLTKAKMADRQQQEGKITDIKTRIALIKKFIQTRRWKYIFG